MSDKENSNIRTDHSTWGDIIEDVGDWISGGAIKKHKRKTKEEMQKIEESSIRDLPSKRAKNVKVRKMT
jgi:hypothetical protein